MNQLGEILRHIPIYQLGLINGKLLGDGNLSIEKNKRPRFRFQHKFSDREWCNHCYDSLKGFIPLAQPKYKKDYDPRILAGYSESVYVQSKTSHVFSYLKEKWYNGRVKVLPVDLLYKTLTPEALAWWYQDDGHLLLYKGNKVRKIILSTDNFSPYENTLLIELLKEKFKLHFSLDGQNRLCLYDRPQIMYFFHQVGDYIHPSMIRKQPQLYSESTQSTNKRTTVYLPFTLTTPTKEIRDKLKTLVPQNYIKSWFKHYELKSDELAITRNGHQVTLNHEEIIKILQVQRETGLTMSEIINRLF